MSRLSVLVTCALLISSSVFYQQALADGEPVALHEMRAAAEALADIDPLEELHAAIAAKPQAPKRPAPSREDLLRQAIRDAVKKEVAREFSAQAPGVAWRGAGAGASGGKGGDGLDNAQAAGAQERNAAVQAQQAQLDHSVNQQQQKSGNANGNGHGNANANSLANKQAGISRR